MENRTTEFFNGVKAELPIMVGVLPFGMIYGVLAVGAGIPKLTSQAMSSVIFAGSAQFIVTQMVKGTVPVLLVLLTIFIVKNNE